MDRQMTEKHAARIRVLRGGIQHDIEEDYQCFGKERQMIAESIYQKNWRDFIAAMPDNQGSKIEPSRLYGKGGRL